MPTTTDRLVLAGSLFVMALAALATGSAAARAAGPEAHAGPVVAAPEPRAFAAQLPQRRELTLPEAIAIAQGRYPGRVVRAQTLHLGNGAVHEIRIIGNDGLVHTVRVDASTGAVK